MTNKDIILDLFNKNIDHISVETSEMAKTNCYAVYKLTSKNVDWVAEKTQNLKYVGVPKGLNTHWFK